MNDAMSSGPIPTWPLEIELGSGDYQIVASGSDSIAVVYDEGLAMPCATLKCRSIQGTGRIILRSQDQIKLSCRN